MTLRSLDLPALFALTLLVGCVESSEEEAGESTGSETATSGETTEGETGGESLGSCEGEVFVSGTVTREMQPTNWNEPFVPTAEAHVIMTLGDFILDGPTTAVAERDLPFVELPFEFAICADAEMVEAMQQGELTVDMQIFNHAGDDVRVGDLISEYSNGIEGPTQGMEILVSGSEHCDDPNAGGFCTTNEG